MTPAEHAARHARCTPMLCDFDPAHIAAQRLCPANPRYESGRVSAAPLIDHPDESDPPPF